MSSEHNLGIFFKGFERKVYKYVAIGEYFIWYSVRVGPLACNPEFVGDKNCVKKKKITLIYELLW